MLFRSHRNTNSAKVEKYHPFIQGLIDKLPTPETAWALKDRAKWLTTAANIFDLMYLEGNDDGVAVSLEGNTLSIKTGAKYD